MTWKISAGVWNFSAEEHAELQSIGKATAAFYHALEKLYLASAENRSILRNSDLRTPWVAEILDRGKPPRLVAHSRSKAVRGMLPPVIRPDLLITDSGFALTELDSVPGGIALTAALEEAYCGDSIIPKLFMQTVCGDGKTVAVAVADEAESYRPEFEWLSAKFPNQLFVCHPNDLEVKADGAFLAGTHIDVIYRFFELFDLANVSCADALMDCVERGDVVVTPPMRPFQEEKMSLALFHHPALSEFWRENFDATTLELLRKIVSATWIVEPVENLPACASLLAPEPIRDWHELEKFSRRRRELVLKASGFSPDAWGSRSVTIGTDASQTEWAEAVRRAILSGEKDYLFVLQTFKRPALVDYAFDAQDGSAVKSSGRARICPYYFAGTLAGALATLCPADKKIIHGMSVASLMPCTFSLL